MNPGRNDPCPCGSGKKYKHCCERKSASAGAVSHTMPDIGEFSRLIERFNAGDLDRTEVEAHALTQRFPDFAPAWKLHGLCLHRLGKKSDALAALQQAIQLASQDAEAYFNLGITQESLEQFTAAATSYRKAISLQSDFVAAHNNLGNILRMTGQFDAAVASCRQAIKLSPGYAAAHYNLGLALQGLGQLDAAAASFRKTIELYPLRIDTYVNLATVLQQQELHTQAITCCRQALSISPNTAEVHNCLGLSQQGVGQYADSAISFRRALELKPDFADACINLGNALAYMGQFGDAQSYYRQATLINPTYYVSHSNVLLTLNYLPTTTAAAYLAEAIRYGEAVTRNVPQPCQSWRSVSQPQPLRIGLVSADLNNHSVGYFTESLVTHLDPQQIALYAYANSPKQDDLTARIRPRFAAWHDIYNLNDEQVARLIHQDGIHILIDLSGHTSGNRLPVFAWKPAPVQVTWLGLPATSGMTQMDYVLGDAVATPPQDAGHFTERIWRLADSYLCLAIPESAPAVAPLPALRNGFVTFGSFNNLSKINDQVVACWARILQQVPGSQLLLKTRQLQDSTVAQTTLQRFVAQGIAPERIRLIAVTPGREEHLAMYHQVDIGLDPYPYPGVTTTAEALWMGVPVLSLQGERFLSRTAASIAHYAGLPDWVADNEADYESKAIQFARDLPELAALRAQLRAQVRTSPLFDAPRFARNFEQAMGGMWQAHTQ